MKNLLFLFTWPVLSWDSRKKSSCLRQTSSHLRWNLSKGYCQVLPYKTKKIYNYIKMRIINNYFTVMFRSSNIFQFLRLKCCLLMFIVTATGNKPMFSSKFHSRMEKSNMFTLTLVNSWSHVNVTEKQITRHQG